MSKGILIFAINSNFDYIKSAEFAAKQAKHFLNLPVTLVTNNKVTSEYFDTVIIIDDTDSTDRQYLDDSGVISTTKWFNQSRTRAYELSPYDQTLLIDADYFMFNNSLITMFDTDTEFACFDKVNDVTGKNPEQFRLSDISIPMVWATVVYFKKCMLSQSVFQFMETIKENWDYYAMLYNFRSHHFRNDFAISIALMTLTGYSTKEFARLPGKLNTIFTETRVESVVNNNEITFSWDGQANKIINTNVHCMNKKALSKFYA